MTLKQVLHEHLCAIPVFPQVRTAYRFAFNHGEYEHEMAMREFYSQFISPGDLVFDVGANMGETAEVFLALGAHVVAVEANPFLCDRLHHISERAPLTVENVAAGNCMGDTTLHIGVQPGHSTVSDEWMNHVARTWPEQHRWKSEVRVPMVTLDSLAAKYGVPAFVKIDVEGFEEQVLHGMTFRAAALTFEYVGTQPDRLARCLALLPEYRFNLTVRQDHRQLFSVPASAQVVLAKVREDCPSYGDVICTTQLR